ncbi:MAG: S41 family peptidase [Acidobacteria bacterium]|nr:S41 family peptidase [Acidobacteriota bacterium]
MIELSRQDRKAIFSKVCRLVETRHFNTKLNGVDWHSIIEARAARILELEDAEEFEKEIHELVSQLKTSHTGFFHQSARRIPARFAINATFQRCQTNDGERWMFLDVHEGGPAHAAGIEPGDLLMTLNGEEIRPPIAPMFRMGEPIQIAVQRRDGTQLPSTLPIPNPKSKERPMAVPRAISFSKLSDGIGLLKATMFPGAVGIDVARDTTNAMQELSECTRLIVDLRGNTGGGIGGLRLMSYLTPAKLPVGYSLTKRRADKGYDKEKLPRFGQIPSRKSALPLLVLRYAFVDKSIVVVTEGLGPQKFHGRVVMLVNQHTTSAGEMIAAFAKENNLATIVGTTTAGRLLSGSVFKVGHGYILGLPVAAYLTWQGTLLEGKGVAPDMKAELPSEALRQGRDLQMDMALEIAKGPQG